MFTRRHKTTFGPIDWVSFLKPDVFTDSAQSRRRIFYQSPNRIAELENLKRARKSGLGARK